MISFYSKGVLCDFELRFGPYEPVIQAHRLILSHRNKYFKKLFDENPNLTFIDYSEELGREMTDLLIRYEV